MTAQADIDAAKEKIAKKKTERTNVQVAMLTAADAIATADAALVAATAEMTA
jgi:hypothetical protein